MAKAIKFNPKNLISSNLRKIRLSMKPIVTQVDLVARLGVRGIEIDKTAISKIETGKRPVIDIELVAIADALGISVVKLLEK